MVAVAAIAVTPTAVPAATPTIGNDELAGWSPAPETRGAPFKSEETEGLLARGCREGCVWAGLTAGGEEGAATGDRSAGANIGICDGLVVEAPEIGGIIGASAGELAGAAEGVTAGAELGIVIGVATGETIGVAIGE
jgi:hypothetical protein